MSSQEVAGLGRSGLKVWFLGLEIKGSRCQYSQQHFNLKALLVLSKECVYN